MKTTRRFLSGLLVLAMILALCPVISFTVTAATTVPTTTLPAYETKTDGVYVGVDADKVKNLTYLSVDGDDEDTNPDLLLEYYTHNQTAANYTIAGGYVDSLSSPFAPVWNTSIGSSFFTRGNNSTAQIKKETKTETTEYKKDDTLGWSRTKNGGTWYFARLYLGYNTSTKLSTEMDYGIGVQPALSQPAYLTFNVEDYDVFYSVVGITGSAFNVTATNVPKDVTVTVNGTTTVTGTGTKGVNSNTGSNTVVFSVYGSPNANAAADDTSFVLLAESEEINGWESGEFNVDISDYKTLKLVATGNGTSIHGCESAWGNACVYSTKVETNTTGYYTGMNADQIYYLSDLYSSAVEKYEPRGDFTLDTPAEKDTNNDKYYKSLAFVGYSDPAGSDSKNFALGLNSSQKATVNGTSVTGMRMLTVYNQSPLTATEVTNGTTTDGTKITTTTVYRYHNQIVLGPRAVPFNKGLTFKAVTTAETYVVYDVSGMDVDHFYSVVGINGTQNYHDNRSKISLSFEVYGANADSGWQKLAYVSGLTAAKTGEIDVNIEGYDYIKLVCVNEGSVSVHAAWGNAAFYKEMNCLGKEAPAGKSENAINITYLSDLATNTDGEKVTITAAQNKLIDIVGTLKTNRGYHDSNAWYTEGVKTLSGSGIKLGYNAVAYEKGLGFHPNTASTISFTDRYMVFDVSELDAERFYAVVGATGSGLTAEGEADSVTFELLGSKAETYDKYTTEFELLSSVTHINGYESAEFDVDVSGYTYLKLLVKMSEAGMAYGSSGVVWADACVYSVNPYEGKTVSILGDSISTWTHVSNDITANTTIGNNTDYFGVGRYDLETRQDTWWQQTIDALGMELVVNNAWGGSCIWNPRMNRTDLGETSVGWGDRCVNLHNDNENYEETPDVILVFLGTNDWSYRNNEGYEAYSNLGSYEDIDFDALVTGDGAAPTTTCEAYAVMLARMQAMYPNTEIWCMTPLPREDGLEVGDPAEFCTDLIQIAEHYGCGVVDMSNLFGTDTETYHTYISVDDVHPLKAGMDAISQAVVSALRGKTTELHDVSFDLENVESVDGRVVIAGNSYTATLRAAQSVTVTMGGEDITASCYSNGVVAIDKVTGDVVITATSNSIAIDYVGKSDSVNGRPASVNLQYLSGLHNTTTTTSNGRTQIINDGTNDYVITVPSKVTLNESYSYPNFYFISNDRYQSNGKNTAVDGYREFNGVQYNTYGIHLGYVAKTYEYGLGVHPNAVGGADNEIVYNVSSLAGDRFYAVVGVNGNNITEPDYYSRYVNFEVWGSADGVSYKRIAHALNLRVYLTAEFDIDISGYNYIKLVTRMSDESRNNWSCAAAWADACVYSKADVNRYGENVLLQDELKIGFYFSLNGKATKDSMVGALLWTKEAYDSETDFTVTGSGKNYENLGVLANTTNMYYVENDGVYAQNIDQVYVMIPYYVDGNGAYVYGEAQEYSVLAYAQKVYAMTDEDWTNKGYTAAEGAATKSIVIDLVNYATAASAYFGDNLAHNSFMNDVDRVVSWNESLRVEDHVQESAANNFYGRNINLLEAITIGIYYSSADTISSASYWPADDSTKVEAATIEEYDGGYKKIIATGVCSDNIYDSYYIEIRDAEGNVLDTTCSSVAAYLTDAIDKYSSSEDEQAQALVALCQAMLVYGNNAETYFS